MRARRRAGPAAGAGRIAVRGVLLALTLSACGGDAEPMAGTDTTGGGTDTGDPVGPPVCCGCLCVDPQWSCTDTTCVDASGRATELVSEAGFLELEAVDARQTRWPDAPSEYRVPATRIWYVFHPAEDEPKRRPLVVFWNGGPGYSTALLLGLGTAPRTVDPDVVPEGGSAPNPARWSRFANLLYVDARSAGFSYEVDPVPLDETHYNSEQDAADFLRVIVRFVERHPQLATAPIVLAGESYGGRRATIMLRKLRNIDALETPEGEGGVSDPALAAELRAFFGGRTPTPDEVAARISHQVLIQPSLLTDPQQSAAVERGGIDDSCPSGDLYDCGLAGWLSFEVDHVARQMVDPEVLAEIIGGDPTTIEWMYGTYRGNAYRQPELFIEGEDAMVAVFGPLPPDVHYFVPNHSISLRGIAEDLFDDVGYTGRWFAENLMFVRTFLTNAALDGLIVSEAIPWAVAYDYPDLVTGFERLETGGGPRPGVLRFEYAPGVLPDGDTRDVRFPRYEMAGHTVSSYQPQDLADDVQAWLEATGAL